MNAPDKLRIALGQLNMLVGDVAGNAKAIVAAAERACSELDTDLLVLPELTLSGYPPEDLLFHRGFRVAVEKGMATLKSARGNRALAARLLQTTERILGYKVRKYRIDPGRYRA